MKRCNACRAPYRGAGARVYVPRDGQLVRTNVCPSCAGAAIAVLVAAPARDARVCAVCKTRPAAMCEPCVMATRTAAARAANAERASIRGVQEPSERAARLAARMRELHIAECGERWSFDGPRVCVRPTGHEGPHMTSDEWGRA